MFVENRRINNETSRTYIVWLCDNNGMEMMRPCGRQLTEGCGSWNMTSSKHNVFDMPKSKAGYSMGKCSACRRKTRLNPNNKNLRVFDNRKTAKSVVEALNSARGEE